MTRRTVLSTMLVAAVAAGCTVMPAEAQSLTSKRIISGLSRPVYVDAPPGDTERLFIVEQRSGSNGRIQIYKNGALLGTPFVIIGPVATGNEQGLLGLAFHPDYANNGFFYVNYTRSGGDTVIERYQVSADPDVADPNSGQVVMIVDQPFSNHNGGWIEFGPDGYLYIGFGDGGSGNDPGNRAQNLNEWMGKMIRVDVDSDDFPNDPDRNYAIPADNPFVGQGVIDEIWAYGLRNPWRCDFDDMTGDLYMGDVGQNAVEEIDFQPGSSAGGENYGWRCMEGTRCTGLSGCTCDDPSLTMPIYDYNHSQGCSVTGGVVYRGIAIPGLGGTYFFSDFCSARIWTFEYVDGEVQNFQDRTTELIPDIGTIGAVSSFGEDGNGEIYICDLGGEVFKIVSDAIPCEDVKKLRGRCKANGTIKVKVRLRTDVHDGREVTVEIDGEPTTIVISGKKAKDKVCCSDAGDHVLALTDPAGCLDPVTVTCP